MDPRQFGRRFVLHDETRSEAVRLGADLRLFATTFAAGFLFVTVLIA
jgi:hypothetical protein